MGTYSFSEAAVADLEAIYEYVAQNDPDAAIKLFETIRQKCQTVTQFPNMGKQYDRLAPSLRGFILDDYIVFYFPREDGIDVSRVVSGYRDLETLF